MIETISKSLVWFIALVICATGVSAQTQASSSGTKGTSPTGSVPTSRRIRARSGDTVLTIAERYKVSAEEVARLNRLGVKGKLRRAQRLFIPAAAIAQSPTSNVDEGLPNGKLINFDDGGTVHVDNAWWRGDELWFTRRGVTETSSRKVKSIQPVFVASVKPTNPGTLPPIVASEKTADTTASTWIYLVGGAKFKVDEVKETADGAWYQRGNLLSFLDRGRIDHIGREVPGAAPAEWKESGWTSGNPMIDQLIRTNGGQFGVDPYLVFLVIEQESHFRTRAISPKGARGLMQLMPGTARRFGVSRPFDPIQNIRGGTRYLKELLAMFNGRVDLALASYNAGEGRVIQYGHKVPPFQETREYVRRISKRYSSGAGSRRNVRKPGADE